MPARPPATKIYMTIVEFFFFFFFFFRVKRGIWGAGGKEKGKGVKGG